MRKDSAGVLGLELVASTRAPCRNPFGQFSEDHTAANHPNVKESFKKILLTSLDGVNKPIT